jgi:C4-dicarboxylate transporter DctQ subunit
VQHATGAAHTVLVHIGLLAGALFTGVVAVLGARFVHHLYGTGHYAAVLDVPMWAVYLAVPLGSALMCFRFFEASWRFHHTGELAKHDSGALPGLDDAGTERSR